MCVRVVVDHVELLGDFGTFGLFLEFLACEIRFSTGFVPSEKKPF